MNNRDISTAKNPDLRASLAGMRRAGQLARKIAIQTQTEIILYIDGDVVAISASKLRLDEDDG